MQSSRFVTSHDGTQIWCSTLGQGPAIILCDGFACDGFIWPYVIDHFCQDYTMVRWHYRGHGRSKAPEEMRNLSVQDLCMDLQAVMEGLEIETAILAGHSMGVQVILESYDRFPERVRALVPICGTYMRPLDTFKNTDLLARALPYLDKVAKSAPGAVQAVWSRVINTQIAYALAHLTEINATLIHGEDFRPYLEHTANMDVQVYLGMLHHLAEHTAEHVLSEIQVPTLIFASEFDSFTPLERSRTMHALIPESELVIMPGATHVGPLELPDTVNGAMERFFKHHGLWPA